VESKNDDKADLKTWGACDKQGVRNYERAMPTVTARGRKTDTKPPASKIVEQKLDTGP